MAPILENFNIFHFQKFIINTKNQYNASKFGIWIIWIIVYHCKKKLNQFLQLKWPQYYSKLGPNAGEVKYFPFSKIEKNTKNQYNALKFSTWIIQIMFYVCSKIGSVPATKKTAISFETGPQRGRGEIFPIFKNRKKILNTVIIN